LRLTAPISVTNGIEERHKILYFFVDTNGMNARFMERDLSF